MPSTAAPSRTPHPKSRLPGRTAGCLAATLAACLLLSACAGTGTPDDAGEPAAPPPVPSTWAYICPDGLRFSVHYRTGEAALNLAERQLELPRVPAASGARYEDGGALFWERGGEAMLEMDGAAHGECRGRRADTPPDAARLLGFDFRGLGQEPGWLVDVDADAEVRWVGDYGTVRFATGAPERAELDGGAWEWRAGTGDRRIAVRVRPEPCRDAMSGQPFTHTVEVTVDGRELRGCGAWLDGG